MSFGTVKDLTLVPIVVLRTSPFSINSPSSHLLTKLPAPFEVTECLLFRLPALSRQSIFTVLPDPALLPANWQSP
jgi:hypothetical protein